MDEFRLYHYGVLKFFYESNILLPSILNSFFDFTHIPVVREVPKKYFHLDNGEFSKSDYYGILNEFYNTQSSHKIDKDDSKKTLKNKKSISSGYKSNLIIESNYNITYLSTTRSDLFSLCNKYLKKNEFLLKWCLKIDVT
ncbi:MAG: hypothetical protein IPM38_03980 [Ignavibacteria bacterium]|nr:hypothetical protein [Ignavibacteria bacterium]